MVMKFEGDISMLREENIRICTVKGGICHDAHKGLIITRLSIGRRGLTSSVVHLSMVGVLEGGLHIHVYELENQCWITEIKEKKGKQKAKHNLYKGGPSLSWMVVRRGNKLYPSSTETISDPLCKSDREGATLASRHLVMKQVMNQWAIRSQLTVGNVVPCRNASVKG
nr:hypothetical protein Iba_chr04dCG12350 [Ipomoea batatas]